jgi:hypothetical protein
LYIRWQFSHEKEEAVQKGLPVPDEASAKEKYLGHGVSAPDLEIIKDFLRCKGMGSRGLTLELQGRRLTRGSEARFTA